MDNQIQELKKTLSDAKSILILMPATLTTDIVVSALSMYQLCQGVMKKETLMGTSKEIPVRFKRLFEEFGVDEKFIIRELKARQYVFSIPDVEKDMEIDLRREDGKVSLYLKTSHLELNSSMIKFNAEGENFDCVLIIGSKSFEALGSFYNKEAFERFNTINIDQGKYNTNYAKTNIINTNSSSVSEVVYDIFKGFNVPIDERIADTLSRGIISGSRVFKYIENPSLFKSMNELSMVAKYNDVIDDYLYSLSIQGLNLRARMFKNMQIDSESKSILSSLTLEDFKELGVESENLIGMDYLPYDICEGFDKTVIVFEEAPNKSRAIIFGMNQRIEIPQFAQAIQNGDMIEILGGLTFSQIEKIINEALGSKFSISQNEQSPQAKQEVSQELTPLVPFTKAVVSPAPTVEQQFGPEAPFKKAS